MIPAGEFRAEANLSVLPGRLRHRTVQLVFSDVVGIKKSHARERAHDRRAAEFAGG